MGFSTSIFRIYCLQHKACKYSRTEWSVSCSTMQTYDGIMVGTIRDQPAIFFPPAHSIEPQSSDRSGCTDKSSRNSRIKSRSISGPPFSFPLRQPWRWIHWCRYFHTLRIQFIIGLTAKKQKHFGNVSFWNDYTMNSPIIIRSIILSQLISHKLLYCYYGHAFLDLVYQVAKLLKYLKLLFVVM